MAVIGNVTNGKSVSSSARYPLHRISGKHVLKNNTEQWLKENNVKQPLVLQGTRAFAVGSTNGVDPLNPTQMTDLNRMYGQTKERNQTLRIAQSFSSRELDAKNPKDWQKANDYGVELAQKLFPDNQAVVYTHIDGKNHHVHNHIVINKVCMTTGKKLSFGPSGPLEQIRKVNDEISREHHLEVPKKLAESRIKQSEHNIIARGGYSWKDYLRNVVNYAQQHTSSWNNYEKVLNQRGININVRGKDEKISYSLINKATGKLVRCRASKLVDEQEKFKIGGRYDWITKPAIELGLKRSFNDDLALEITDAERVKDNKGNSFRFQFSKNKAEVQKHSLPLPPAHNAAELKRLRKKKQLLDKVKQQQQADFEEQKAHNQTKKVQRQMDEEKHGTTEKQKALENFLRTHGLNLDR